ncbi:MAG: ABC transporter ATP-binding protein, partial [Candidatus Hydrogenedentes bacterium]|nr:ABC transporter ATP-binding protein [Candidatus Hydrogenedentota bacterium]
RRASIRHPVQGNRKAGPIPMIRGTDENSNYDARNATRVRKGYAWRVYKRLLGYVFRYRLRLAAAFVFGLFVAVSLPAIVLGAKGFVDIVFEKDPAVVEAIKQEAASRIERVLPWAPDGLDATVGSVIDYLRADGMEMRAMMWLAAFVLVVMIFSAVSRFVQEYLSASIALNVTIELGKEMYENIIRLGLRFFERHTTGEIIARLTNDIFTAGRGLTQVFMKLLREPIKAVAALCIALWIDPYLTAIGLAVLPPVALVILRIGRSVRKRMRRSLEKVAELQSVAKESIAGISIVKGFCMEASEVQRMHREYRKLQRQGLKMLKADAAVGPITELIMVCGFVVFIVLSARKVIVGDLSLSALGALYVALGGMLDPVRKLSAVNNAIQTSVASAMRAFEFIDLKPDIAEAPDAVELPPIRESLRFQDVRFSYTGDVDVLDGVDFEVKKGEMVAIVGFSGAGKSTIAKLVPRFYDVTAGAVLIDGTDVRRATLTSLRGQISIVTQETILFNETVAMNIAAGRPEYTEERVREAARAAHAHGFIEALPQGYAANIGESGGTLSGGQRQRLAIARALIKDPAILILDEATSSLDSESEKAIQQAIEEFVVGRTSIVIAHRLSTIQRADRILVLDGGRIVEEGSHAELMQRDSSIYRRLYEVQFASAESAPANGPAADPAAE